MLRSVRSFSNYIIGFSSPTNLTHTPNPHIQSFLSSFPTLPKQPIPYTLNSSHFILTPIPSHPTPTDIRSSTANAARLATQIYPSIPFTLALPHPQAASEGAHLGTYSFNYKRSQNQTTTTPTTFHPLPNNNNEFNIGRILANAQNQARTWMNMPSNILSPTTFPTLLTHSAPSNVKIRIYKQQELESMKFNAMLSVARGSTQPATMVELHYKASTKQPIALIGKGITFDSGGISIKPSTGMSSMKADMGGAAVCAATLYAVAQLKLPITLTAYLPLCENMPSGNAYKPGDIIITRDGTSIEVDNTDAEGRLILADVLNWVSREKQVKTIIDVATLTGAIDVALGPVYSGLFTNNNVLAKELIKASNTVDDPMWRMPVNSKYKQLIESDVADLKNAASRSAGACTAAVFLQEFVKEGVEWAHVDMAGVMENKTTKEWQVKGMSGRPVRALVEYLTRTSGK